MNKNELIVKKLWDIFNAREFCEVRSLLADNFVCFWPQSNEIICGANNFILVNENYPGKWAINCKRIVSSGEVSASEVELTCDGKKVYATSFFEFKDGKISKLTEYWGDSYAAPKWRSKWVARA